MDKPKRTNIAVDPDTYAQLVELVGRLTIREGRQISLVEATSTAIQTALEQVRVEADK